MAERSDREFPLRDFLGLFIDSTSEGEATGHITIAPQHLNPHGGVHGAIIFAALDTLMGSAVMSLLPEGELTSTSDLHIRYHRAVNKGELRFRARIIHQGRRTLVLAGEAYDLGGQLVATATASFIRRRLTES